MTTKTPAQTTPSLPRRPEDWTAEERLQIVMEVSPAASGTHQISGITGHQGPTRWHQGGPRPWWPEVRTRAGDPVASAPVGR